LVYVRTIVLFICLVFLPFYSCIYELDSRKSNEVKVIDKDIVLSAYRKIIKAQWELENSPINFDADLYDKDKNVLKISDVIDDDNHFVLYFKWDECQDCISQELYYFKHIPPLLKISVIISFDNLTSYLSYASSWDYEFPLYYLPDYASLYENFNPSLGVHSFVIKNRTLTNAHLASASFPELSKLYYEIISNKYRISE
jgi:hypothetical protein